MGAKWVTSRLEELPSKFLAKTEDSARQHVEIIGDTSEKMLGESPKKKLLDAIVSTGVRGDAPLRDQINRREVVASTWAISRKKGWHMRPPPWTQTKTPKSQTSKNPAKPARKWG